MVNSAGQFGQMGGKIGQPADALTVVVEQGFVSEATVFFVGQRELCHQEVTESNLGHTLPAPVWIEANFCFHVVLHFLSFIYLPDETLRRSCL